MAQRFDGCNRLDGPGGHGASIRAAGSSVPSSPKELVARADEPVDYRWAAVVTAL